MRSTANRDVDKRHIGRARSRTVARSSSHPLAAAALIIACNQLGLLMGINLSRSNQLHVLGADLMDRISEFHPGTFVFGVIGILFIVVRISAMDGSVMRFDQ